VRRGMRVLEVEEMMMIKYRKRAHATLLEPFAFFIPNLFP